MVNSILLRCILWKNNDIKSASLPWQLAVFGARGFGFARASSLFAG